MTAPNKNGLIRAHPSQAFARLDGASLARGSPARFWPETDVLGLFLVLCQPSKGLRPPARLPLILIGVGSSALSFLDRVAREVAGGEAGANLGALGVSTFSSKASAGVSTSFSVTWACSSMSVSASSSGFGLFSLVALVGGKSRRGFTAGREELSPSVNFLKTFFPRLMKQSVSRLVGFQLRAVNLQDIEQAIVTLQLLLNDLLLNGGILLVARAAANSDHGGSDSSLAVERVLGAVVHLGQTVL